GGGRGGRAGGGEPVPPGQAPLDGGGVREGENREAPAGLHDDTWTAERDVAHGDDGERERIGAVPGRVLRRDLEHVVPRPYEAAALSSVPDQLARMSRPSGDRGLTAVDDEDAAAGLAERIADPEAVGAPVAVRRDVRVDAVANVHGGWRGVEDDRVRQLDRAVLAGKVHDRAVCPFGQRQPAVVDPVELERDRTRPIS